MARYRTAKPQTRTHFDIQAERWSWALLAIAVVVLASYVLPYIWRAL